MTTELFQEKFLLDAIKKIFISYGSSESEALLVAETLISSSLMGLDSHGILRVPQYVESIKNGQIVPGSKIEVIEETNNTAVVNVNWNFGQVGARFAAEIALKKALSDNISCVILKKSNHLGRLGSYTEYIANNGLIGLAMCSSLGAGHWIAPWGGSEGRLATNPISFAAPTKKNPILVDISTSVISEGKIRLIRNCGGELPEGCILNAKGETTTKTSDFYSKPMGTILPLGGIYYGYKGYFLSIIVEILSRVLSGEKYLENSMGSMGNGLWIMALNIEAFMNKKKYFKEINSLVEYLNSSHLSLGFSRITIPGDREFDERKKRKKNGIPIDSKTWNRIKEIAKELKIFL